ncbi:MAG: HU family DNA-binding protein [Eubacteriales bacterium]|jgi:DNA-binding protein HU-beta|nr:HU family DNA-binding protein [Clostridiales bacterium]MDD7396428.1 HU family DNA-binding protein [Eubacteriales bacterium]MDY2982533.1 HU family DNA-binding protein [Eubacteriales bacterium]
MNKAELIAAVAEKTNLSRKDVDNVVNTMLDTIMDTLRSGDKVSLVGFGSFEAKERPARKGHNPMTGEVIDIKASKAPSFKPGKSLKETLN